MKIAVSFADHSEAIKAKLERKLRAGLNEAAVELAIGYREGLQASHSPPYSSPGEIPHEYTKFLASYIEGGVSGSGDSLKGVVGFEPSHVTSRSQNYLIHWDQGTIKRVPDVVRPWIIPLYQRTKAAMITAFSEIARKTQ